MKGLLTVLCLLLPVCLGGTPQKNPYPEYQYSENDPYLVNNLYPYHKDQYPYNKPYPHFTDYNNDNSKPYEGNSHPYVKPHPYNNVHPPTYASTGSGEKYPPYPKTYTSAGSGEKYPPYPKTYTSAGSGEKGDHTSKHNQYPKTYTSAGSGEKGDHTSKHNQYPKTYTSAGSGEKGDHTSKVHPYPKTYTSAGSGEKGDYTSKHNQYPKTYASAESVEKTDDDYMQYINYNSEYYLEYGTPNYKQVLNNYGYKEDPCKNGVKAYGVTGVCFGYFTCDHKHGKLGGVKWHDCGYGYSFDSKSGGCVKDPHCTSACPPHIKPSYNPYVFYLGGEEMVCPKGTYFDARLCTCNHLTEEYSTDFY